MALLFFSSPSFLCLGSSSSPSRFCCWWPVVVTPRLVTLTGRQHIRRSGHGGWAHHLAYQTWRSAVLFLPSRVFREIPKKGYRVIDTTYTQYSMYVYRSLAMMNVAGCRQRQGEGFNIYHRPHICSQVRPSSCLTAVFLLFPPPPLATEVPEVGRPAQRSGSFLFLFGHLVVGIDDDYYIHSTRKHLPNRDLHVRSSRWRANPRLQ